MGAITPESVIESARSYLKVPFHHQGRGRFGIDCIGLVSGVAKDNEVEFEDTLVYSALSPRNYAIIETFEKHLDQVEWDDRQGGDVVVFYIRKKKYPQHAGILTSPDTIIHAHSGVEKVTEHPLGENWIKRVHSLWRFKY